MKLLVVYSLTEHFLIMFMHTCVYSKTRKHMECICSWFLFQYIEIKKYNLGENEKIKYLLIT